MIVTMWEVRAADDRADELIGWVVGRVGGRARVYRSTDPAAARVVAIGPSDVLAGLAAVPAELAARAAQAWDFEEI